MRPPHIFALSCLAWVFPVLIHGLEGLDLQRRQQLTGSSDPTLTTGSSNVASSSLVSDDSTISATVSSTQNPYPTSTSLSAGEGSRADSTAIPRVTATPGSTVSPSSFSPLPTASIANSTANAGRDNADKLPLPPTITPAFAVGGVILILAGATLGLIGVKNRWIQVFLSTALLTSLCVAVLIDYVMSPPVRDAIQGGYLVAIFMTGVIFGAGALIFKETAEGFGCLLGGFCLSMWVLVLKPGGLLPSPAAKGIFIAVCCVVAWSLSFSHYTRACGLIASTSFSGATALVLGIDCFSGAGLKEFWFYIWALNANLFPLNTNTYPVTRSIRAETVVIILAWAVGILSQIKLWRNLTAHQRETDATRLEDERQRNAEDEAVGREVQQRDDRDRSQWEKQYGDSRTHRRTDSLPDKHFSSVSTVMDPSYLSSSETLDVTTSEARKSLSIYGLKNKRHSSANAEAIAEIEEGQETRPSAERQKALANLEQDATAEEAELMVEAPPTTVKESRMGMTPAEAELAIAGAEASSSVASGAVLQTDVNATKTQSPINHRSLPCLEIRSPRRRTVSEGLSESQEQPTTAELHSTASSAGATVDEDNEPRDMASLEKGTDTESGTSQTEISRAGSHENLRPDLNRGSKYTIEIREVSPLPPALSVSLDFDPEEFARPRPDDPDLTVRREDDTTLAMTSHVPKAEATSSRNDPAGAWPAIADSTVDGLTKNALDQVPNQVSNVLLSYRTNEWAKHISTADSPIFDEPQVVEAVDDDPPKQPTVAIPDPFTTCSGAPAPAPSALPDPVLLEPHPPRIHAGISDRGVPIGPRRLERSFSDLEWRKPASRSPSRSAEEASRKRNLRSRSTPMLSKQSLVATTIDENAAADFPQVRTASRRTSLGSPHKIPSQTSLASLNKGNRSRRQSTSYGGQSARSSDIFDVQYLTRPSSQLGRMPGSMSDTRMDFDQFRPQPHRNTIGEAERREALLAEWRLSQQSSAANAGLPQALADRGIAQLKQDKEQQRLFQEQHRVSQQRKQYALGQAMRRSDMQELHREALRKMQARANEKIQHAEG